MNQPSALLERVSQKIGDRALFWFGTRGTDAQPLLGLEQFAGVFSLVAPLESGAADLVSFCLESASSRRVDLNAYSIDSDRSDAVDQLYRAIAHNISGPTVIAAYRPSDFLASVCYPRGDLVEYLGLFHGRQSAFEHKAWVENELAKEGIRTIPWRYYADYMLSDLEADVRNGRPDHTVIRANTSDGGRGLLLVHREDQVLKIPQHFDHFFAAAPFLHPSIPLNVGACVYQDASVSLHGPSVQLIGIESCVRGRFGYCGNDFAATLDAIGKGAIQELEQMTTSIGVWLWRNGYVGAFGVDALFHEGELYLTEINPRFQGSSASSADLDDALGRDNIFSHHLAACLGLDGPEQADATLCEIAVEQAKERYALSNVICYNSSGGGMRLREDGVLPEPLGPHATTYGIPRTEVIVEPEAMLFKIRTDLSVTDDGYALTEQTAIDLVDAWVSSFEPEDQRT